MKPIFVLFLMSLLPLNAHALTAYQDGDIIFQESLSLQSRAIKEVTNSRWSHVGILFQQNGQWLVAEAVQPVKMTPLNEWRDRGRNHAFRVYRARGLTDSQRKDLRTQVDRLMGQNYDIYFEWSDTLIYCSELVYKTFLKATQIKIGTVQHYRDMNLDGPFARALIKKRIEDTGRTLNMDEPIVTPASQMSDPKLELIEAADQ